MSENKDLFGECRKENVDLNVLSFILAEGGEVVSLSKSGEIITRTNCIHELFLRHDFFVSAKEVDIRLKALEKLLDVSYRKDSTRLMRGSNHTGNAGSSRLIRFSVNTSRSSTPFQPKGSLPQPQSLNGSKTPTGTPPTKPRRRPSSQNHGPVKLAGIFKKSSGSFSSQKSMNSSNLESKKSLNPKLERGALDQYMITCSPIKKSDRTLYPSEQKKRVICLQTSFSTILDTLLAARPATDVSEMFMSILHTALSKQPNVRNYQLKERLVHRDSKHVTYVNEWVPLWHSALVDRRPNCANAPNNREILQTLLECSKYRIKLDPNERRFIFDGKSLVEAITAFFYVTELAGKAPPEECASLTEVLRILSNHRAKVNSVSIKIIYCYKYRYRVVCMTPLHSAVKSGNLKLVSDLLAMGADPDLPFVVCPKSSFPNIQYSGPTLNGALEPVAGFYGSPGYLRTEVSGYVSVNTAYKELLKTHLPEGAQLINTLQIIKEIGNVEIERSMRHLFENYRTRTRNRKNQ